MSGFISQSFPSNFLAGLRSLFNSPHNESQAPSEANQASAKNPSPAAPQKLSVLKTIQNFFASFMPTKTVPVAPQALGSNARANTSQRLEQYKNASAKVEELRPKLENKKTELQEAQKLLKKIEAFNPSTRELAEIHLRGGANIDEFEANKNKEMEKMKATIKQCMADHTALDNEMSKFLRLMTENRD